MAMYDLLQKTRRGEAISDSEMRGLVEGFTRGEIPDYMMSAWLMAVCCMGLTPRETTALTLAMRDSGAVMDHSRLDFLTVDKHSTGGIGDKTTLVILPIVAACGGHVMKMSGRGLGFTGGTIDKLESIPGFSVHLDEEKLLHCVREVGCCVVEQSGDLTPADKKIYALRNLTATVDSIPLIASSVMSKKLAMGDDGIVLDVKYGSGAFMKTPEDACRLAECMVNIGRDAGKRCRALVTDMNEPLGFCVGNALEIAEAVRVLRGEEIPRLTALCIELSAQMLFLLDQGDEEFCRARAREAISSGAALSRFREMIAAQGGDPDITEDFTRLPSPRAEKTVCAPSTGYLSGIRCEEIGLACLNLGAGRTASSPNIDHAAGVLFHVEHGAYISRGAPLFTVYGKTASLCEEAGERILSAMTFSPEKPARETLIYRMVE